MNKKMYKKMNKKDATRRCTRRCINLYSYSSLYYNICTMYTLLYDSYMSNPPD